MNHREMRQILVPAFSRVIGRAASILELQPLQSVASLESCYGLGWKPPGDKSKNLGAQQAGSSWKGKTFEYKDTSPQPDGSSKSYTTRFRFYDTWEQAGDDLVRTVYVNAGRGTVLKAASEGNTARFSAGLYCVSSEAARAKEAAEVLEQFGIAPTGYFQGFGKTATERIRNHHKRVVASIRAQALALGEPLPADIVALPTPVPLLRAGSAGVAVVTLQELLNRNGATPRLKIDGDFGNATYVAVVAFQRRSGLTADGIVGARTLEALNKAQP